LTLQNRSLLLCVPDEFCVFLTLFEQLPALPLKPLILALQFVYLLGEFFDIRCLLASVGELFAHFLDLSL
jgi:hypothetical protein